MQAIVLVGGEGTRLRPLTDEVPKPALTLVDRPFLAYMIEWLAAHGVTEAVLACGFKADVLRDTIGPAHAGVELTYVTEPERRGTAGAIRFVAEELGGTPGERFLALNGDVLADLDLSALVRAHEDSGATATLAVHAVADASPYGLVRTDEAGRVVEFVEKTGARAPGEINAGAYVLERSVLELVPPGREVSIEHEVFPRLVGAGLRALRLDGYWTDVGTPERYLQASWDILEGRVETRVEPTGPGLAIAAGAEVATGASVGPRAVLAEGCRVASGAEIRDSVLLDRCVVGEGARVTGSVLAPGVTVEPRAELADAVVGRDERVPAPR